MNIDVFVINKKSFLIMVIFLWCPIVGMDNKKEIIFIKKSPQLPRKNSEHIIREFEYPKEKKSKNNSNSSFDISYLDSSNQSINVHKKNNSEDMSNSSIDLNFSDFNFDVQKIDCSVKSEDDLVKKIPYLFNLLLAKIDDVNDRIDGFTQTIERRLNLIEKTIVSLENTLPDRFYNYKLKKELEKKYRRQESKKEEESNSPSSSKHSGKPNSRKKSPSKNKKSQKNKVEENRNSRKSIIVVTGQNSPIKEEDEFGIKNKNDGIGSEIYAGNKKAKSSEDNSNKRKSITITRNASENFDSKTIGVITPKKIDKKKSKESLLNSHDSQSTINAESEFQEDDKIPSGRSSSNKLSNNNLRTSSESNNLKKIEE